jgi:uncharacterized protein with NAD-binding domain and iron-sulfur cluster
VREEKPIKVAVIGGGCGALSAAFELTRPEHRAKYEVTVYQLGWRLGGKGASGRGPSNRIEEHGLHLWMGFYENAFRLMRECYAELGRDPAKCPVATWRDAFVPAPFVSVADQRPDGAWAAWAANLPATEGLPGDPLPNGQRWTVGEYLTRSIALVRALLQSLQSDDHRDKPAAPGADVAPDSPESTTTAGQILDRIARFLKYGELATLAAIIEAVMLLETLAGSWSRYPQNLIAKFLDAIATNARAQLESRVGSDNELRRLWTIVDLTLATMRGIVRSGLLTDPRGFDAIDDYDCREWLMLNGASEQSLNSGYLRALYDFVFAYEDGDGTRPRISAGQALRSMVRAFFTYRGSFFWRMAGGMGDIVFAPLYEVLKRRGVRFEFFHRLENVRLTARKSLSDGDGPHVKALEFDVQAEIKGGAEYHPLIDVSGLPSWPSEPDYDQLVEGDRVRREGWNFESFWERRKAGTRVLRVVDDFDFVVLGIGLGAVPYVCKELVASDPRWRAMVDHVKTVPTQAFQVWMSADMSELGWNAPQVTLSGFVSPFDTWADMRHLLDKESWAVQPRALAYFCSVLADDQGPLDRREGKYPIVQREQVRRNAIRFLNGDIAHLWPHALSCSNEFRWDLLVDPNDSRELAPSRSSEDRFESQYWTANVNPSDRYALSLPGSSQHRISPLDLTYDNLTVAGDWTDCGFNAGCVEAAVMSGKLAAHALSRRPPLHDIVGYDHP